jgi:hypothetical protein
MLNDYVGTLPGLDRSIYFSVYSPATQLVQAFARDASEW